jgi:WD40 repeat protein
MMMRYTIFILMLMLVFANNATARKPKTFSTYATDSKFIYDVCFTANGHVLVCTDDKSLKAFSVLSKKLLSGFEGGHRAHILTVDVSPDSTLLASGGADSLLVIRSFISGKIRTELPLPNGVVTSVSFSPDNRQVLAGCSGGSAYLIDIKSNKVLCEFGEASKDITSVAFNRSGDMLAIAGANKLIRIYSTYSNKVIAELNAHTSWVRDISFYNDDRFLVSCGDDRRIYQWNLSNPANIRRRLIRAGNGWTMSIDITNEDERRSYSYVYGSMSGFVKFKHPFGAYHIQIPSPVTKVLLVPNRGALIEIVTATLGSGLILLNASQMEMSQKAGE